MKRYLTTTLVVIVVLATATGALAWKAAGTHSVAAPKTVWLQYGGNPKHTGYTLLKHYVVPAGYCLHITGTNALAEKHHDTHDVDAGEWTVMVGDIAQSSLETNDGIAYQGQGMRNVTVLPGTGIDIGIYLRPEKDPALYYYAVSMMGNLYRCHT
ncbi:MAG TPA: hypothetical protein VNH41_05990 [Steroidobacteraceae bacterium]|nr:hypothetical protein [Steroidobacteraceae bacterium]